MIIELVSRFILEIGLYWTGEAVLYVVTLGRRKPSWDFDAENSSEMIPILWDISLYVGLITWLSVITLICNVW